MTGVAKEPAHNSAPEGGDLTPPSIDELTAFFVDFVGMFIAAGGQTARVARCAQRIGLVFGVRVEMLLLSRHAVITVASRCDGATYRTVVTPFKHIGINFDTAFLLNRLSWEFFDDWLDAPAVPDPGKGGPKPDTASLTGFCAPEEARAQSGAPGTRRELARLKERFYGVIQRPRLSEWVLCLMIGAASASFCRLFGGDWAAMGIVFFASQAAFLVRRFMVVRHHMDIRLGFLAASFTASFLSAVGSWHVPTATPEIAVASGILFLVPGVPLLNAVNDILSGHTLMGISRGAAAAVLTLCIAFGLAVTLMVTGFNVL
jgi:Uncharacterized conserved protein